MGDVAAYIPPAAAPPVRQAFSQAVGPLAASGTTLVTVNLAPAMPDTNYGVLYGIEDNVDPGGGTGLYARPAVLNKTVNSFQLRLNNSSAAAANGFVRGMVTY